MTVSGYEIAHSLPGRIRLVGKRKKTSAINSLGARLAELPGVERVRINPVINSLLILYNPGRINVPAIFTAIRDESSPSAPGRSSAGFYGADDRFLSLLAGGLLFLSYICKINWPPADYNKKYLDYLAAAVIGYSVLNHKGLRQCANKAQHLDTLAGLISIFSIKGENASLGMFITWLLNFIEVMFGWPQYRPGCNAALIKQA